MGGGGDVDDLCECRWRVIRHSVHTLNAVRDRDTVECALTLREMLFSLFASPFSVLHIQREMEKEELFSINDQWGRST